MCRHVTGAGRQGLSSQKVHTGLQSPGIPSSSLMGTGIWTRVSSVPTHNLPCPTSPFSHPFPPFFLLLPPSSPPPPLPLPPPPLPLPPPPPLPPPLLLFLFLLLLFLSLLLFLFLLLFFLLFLLFLPTLLLLLLVKLNEGCGQFYSAISTVSTKTNQGRLCASLTRGGELWPLGAKEIKPREAGGGQG